MIKKEKVDDKKRISCTTSQAEETMNNGTDLNYMKYFLEYFEMQDESILTDKLVL